jgi:citrate synthase
MSEVATLEFKGKKYEFPVHYGVEDEIAFDISKLRDLTGMITLDRGYKNTGACNSEITFLDGELREFYVIEVMPLKIWLKKPVISK